jgi:ABC-type glycerol-3-phosphate transport system substrate-binding protein
VKSFVDFLMEPENANAYAAASGQAPAIPNDEFEASEGTHLQLEYGSAGKTAPVADQLFPTPRVRDAWITTNQALLAGDAEPVDVVTAMDEAWDAG